MRQAVCKMVIVLKVLALCPILLPDYGRPKPKMFLGSWCLIVLICAWTKRVTDGFRLLRPLVCGRSFTFVSL